MNGLKLWESAATATHLVVIFCLVVVDGVNSTLVRCSQFFLQSNDVQIHFHIYGLKIGTPHQ